MTQPANVPSPESLLEHREWLRAIARTLVADESAVDDVEQRTWLTVLRNRRPVTSARGWLRRVVRSAAADVYRSDSRRRAREEATARPEALPPTDHLVMQVEAQRAVAQAVAGLPEPYRTTVLLRYIEELSVADVAARMAVPVKTVQTRLRRAHALLRDALDREFGDRRAWCVALLPLLKARSSVSVGTATTGAVLMATTTKVIAAAVAVALLAAGVVWTTTSSSHDDVSRTDVAAATTSPEPELHAKPRERPVERKVAVVGPSLVVEVLGPGDARIAGAEVTLVSRRHDGEIATTDSYLRAVADPDFGRTALGSARTGPDGTARFDAIAPGNHEFVARAKGFASASATWVDVPAGSVETRTTVRLDRGHRLAGRVVTAAGAPAADRLVDAGVTGWDERGFARTGADGRFVLDDVPASDVSLRVGRARGSNPVLATVRVPDVSEIELRLPAMGAVVGTVTTVDGHPVADAEIGVEVSWGWNANADSLARTDAAGRFRIDEIPAGSLTRFSVRHAGLYHVGPRIEAGRLDVRRSGKDTGFNPRVAAGGELRLDATMAKGARLHGRVVGPEGGVAGAWVYLHMKATKAGQEWETAVTDADGRYAFDFLPPGAAAAVPMHPTCVHPDTPKELGTALAAGSLSAALTFDLPEGGDVERDFTLVAGARIAGRVTGPAGEPVAGATVRVDAATYSSPPTPVAVTDADGTFVIERVAGIGASKLRVQAAGLVQTSVPDVAVAPGGRVDGVVVSMAPAPRVTGHVLDADGAPVAGARVTLSRSGVRPVVASTDATGGYSAAATWLDGKFIVAASAEGKGDGRADAELSAGVAVVDVRLAATSVVTGRVTVVGGGPVVGALVVPRDASKQMPWYYGDLLSGTSDPDVVRAATDDDGRFRLALPSGAWMLIVRGVGLVDEFATVQAPAADEVAVPMHAAATLSGKVRDEEGKPLAATTVLLAPGPDVATPRLSIPAFDPNPIQSADRLLSRHTDAAGTFAFPGIPEGEYTLVVVLPAATSQRFREVRFGPLRPAGGPFDLSLSSPVSNALAGQIVDVGGIPYRDARVMIVVVTEGGKGTTEPWKHLESHEVDAAPDGTFRIDELSSPSYTFQVIVLSGLHKTKLPDGTTADMAKTVQRHTFHGLRPPRADLVLEMTEMPRVRGRLVDDAGAPLASWMVSAEPANDASALTSSANTREDGTFEIRDVEDVDHRLTVQREGQAARRVLLPRPARGGADVGDVVATLEGRIRGRVVDAAGAAVRGATVQLYPLLGGLTQSVTTGDDGSFEATGLDPAAQYRVGVVGTNGRSRWTGTPPSTGVRPGTNDLRLVRE